MHEPERVPVLSGGEKHDGVTARGRGQGRGPERRGQTGPAAAQRALARPPVLERLSPAPSATLGPEIPDFISRT